MSAHCSEVLSPSADLPGVRFLRIYAVEWHGADHSPIRGRYSRYG